MGDKVKQLGECAIGGGGGGQGSKRIRRGERREAGDREERRGREGKAEETPLFVVFRLTGYGRMGWVFALRCFLVLLKGL